MMTEEQHSEYADKLKLVAEEIESALLEIDYINLQANPKILIDYAVKIGSFETQLYEIQLRARREKHKLELMRAKANAGEQIDVATIEATLDMKFELWEKQCKAKIEAQLAAIEKKQASKPLSPEESKELSKLHKTLIKRLHPDINPDCTEQQKKQFFLAQTAYENGDIESLRALAAITEGLEKRGSKVFETEAEAEAQLLCMQAQLKITEERLEQLKQNKPYIYLEKLENTDWVVEQVQPLKDQINEQEQVYAAYKKMTAELSRQ